MKILCLDSTAKVATAAILSDDTVLGEYTVNGKRSHSELMLPMIRSLLTSTGLTPDDIDLFACTVGPGSFTGVRIGVSVIKGIAFGRGKPCAAVSTLEALAENTAGLTGLICPVMDARRAQVYNALFERRDGVLHRLTPDRAISIDELAKELLRDHGEKPVLLVGDGVAVTRDALAAAGVTLGEVPALLLSQNASAVGRVALRMAKNGDTLTDDALRPVYLRQPQAERERLERLEAEKKNQAT